MTTYKKINANTLEVEEQVPDKSQYLADQTRARITELQAELAKLQVIEAEMAKAGM